MFITREEVQARSGIAVTQEILVLAQAMIETYVGRDEADIVDGQDLGALSRATMFQAIYIRENTDIVLEQATVLSLSQNESVIHFDPNMFAPFMSPWAVLACKNLSWMGTRSVSTGAIFGSHTYEYAWERD